MPSETCNQCGATLRLDDHALNAALDCDDCQAPADTRVIDRMEHVERRASSDFDGCVE